MLIHEALGQTVKKIRKEKKITQKTLAEQADLSIDYIHDIEHSIYKPTINVVDALAKALNLKTSELIQQVEELVEKENQDLG